MNEQAVKPNLRAALVMGAEVNVGSTRDLEVRSVRVQPYSRAVAPTNETEALMNAWVSIGQQGAA